MKHFNILQKMIRAFSVLFLYLVTITATQAATISHDINTDHLVIQGTDTDDYFVTGTTTTYQIIVGSGYKGTITLSNVDITSNTIRTHTAACGNGTNVVTTASCIAIMGKNGQGTNLAPVTKVNIVLNGDNNLTLPAVATMSDYNLYCAIQVDQGAQINISASNPNDNSSGTLFARSTAITPGSGLSQGGAAIGAMSAGMGSDSYNCNQGPALPVSGSDCGSAASYDQTCGGNVIISSGTVTAWGGHGAGIGGSLRTFYDGIIIITGGIVEAKTCVHSAGIGSGCPVTGGVKDCYTQNSAIIVLPPAYIEGFGMGESGSAPNPSLALAGTKNITYVNDPAKPLVTVRTQDYEPNATIYLDLTETQGLESIFNAILPEFNLNRTAVGRTNASGTLQFNGLFEQLTTFFTDASSTQPATHGRPYLPVTTTLLSGGTVVLPLLGTDISFTDYWSLPLWVGYSPTDARNHAHRIKVEYNDTDSMTNVTYQIQDGTHFSQSSLTFLAADGVTEIPMPTTIRNGDVFYIVIPVNQGKPLGYYSDVLLINGRYQGVVIPGYIRRIGRQRVAYDDSQNNNHIKVTASPQSFTVPHPTTNTVTLTLNIDHSGMNDAYYEQFNVIARYLVTTESDYDLAVAATPLVTWSVLNVAATSGVDATTTVSFSGMPIGTYYIHWYAESGVAYAHSLTVTAPPRTYGGFGPYIVGDPVIPGAISGPSAIICSGQTAALTGTASTGGTGSYTYTWQSAPSSTGPWTDLSSSDSQNYTTGVLTATTYFRRQTTDGSNYYSNVIQVTVANPPQAAFAITNSTTCGTTQASSAITFSNADQVFINLISGGGSVSGSTISSSGTLITYTPALSSSVQHIVISAVTNNLGGTPCKADTAYWNITVLTNFDPGFIKLKTVSICSGDAGEIIAADSIPAAGGSTTISYEWYKNDVIISGAAGASYTIPPADKVNTGTTVLSYTYTRKAKDTFCQTSFIDSDNSFTLNVYPSFDAGAITSGSSSVCSDDISNITIENAIVASGGNGAITYQWYKNGTEISDAVGMTYDIPPSDRINTGSSNAVITYTRRVQDVTCSGGLVNSDSSYVLTVYPRVAAPTVEKILITGSDCNVSPEETGNIVITAPVGSYEYAVEGFNGGAYQPGTTFANVPHSATAYVVKAKNTTTGCESFTTTSVTVDCSNCLDPPKASFSSTTSSTCYATAVSSTVTLSGSATLFTVSSNGAGNLSPAVESPTGTSVTYTPALADAGKTIRVTATTNNPVGSSCVSGTATWDITVYPDFSPGAIVVNAPSVCSGDASFMEIGSTTSAGGGYGTITYEWYKNDVAIANSNNATYDIPIADRINEGSSNAVITYTRKAKDATCQTTFTGSAGVYTLTVYPSFKPGAIKVDSIMVCLGDDTSRTIGSATAASGGYGTITYEWYKDGVAIPGSNAETYAIPTDDRRDVLTSTTITYTRKAKDATCQTDFMDSKGEYKLTVNPYSTADMLITISDTTICSSSALDLIASAPGVIDPVYRWYDCTTTNPMPLGSGYKYTLSAAETLVVAQTTKTYCVSVSGSNYCEGSGIEGRKRVLVTIKPNVSSNMLTVRDTTICSGESAVLTVGVGAAVSNPVYKWYRSATGGETHLIGTGSTYIHTSDLGSVSGATPYVYYVAASGDNYCEGNNSLDGRKSVTVTVKAISGPKDITISGIAGVCGAESTTLTASALNVLDPVFKWHSNAEGGTPFYVGHEYKTSALKADTTFYVSVSGSNYCEGSMRDTVEVTIACFTVHGTVFPLVFLGDDEIDALFTIEARLYAPPPLGTPDPIAYFRRVLPVHEATAVHYNGSVYVPGTPRNPGYSGSLLNPGAPINWEIINKIPDPGIEKDTTTLRPGEAAATSVGHYTFRNVAPGNYVLTLSRPGFITRYAKVTVASGGTPFIEHRELIGGDVNSSMTIDVLDINAINYRIGYAFGDSGYDARYDINGNTEIEIGDISLVKSFQGFHIQGYIDTNEWLEEYYQE